MFCSTCFGRRDHLRGCPYAKDGEPWCSRHERAMESEDRCAECEVDATLERLFPDVVVRSYRARADAGELVREHARSAGLDAEALADALSGDGWMGMVADAVRDAGADGSALLVEGWVLGRTEAQRAAKGEK